MWVEIEDEKVRNVWKCEHCNKLTFCSPDSYEEVGTPICDKCDEDLFYVRTEFYMPVIDIDPSTIEIEQ